jgi:Ca2+-binding EF-hand superfamily protein
MSSNQFDSQASTNYKEAFSLFDKRGNGRVALDSLGDLLRACGQNPTLAEIKDLEKNIGGDCEFFWHLKFIPRARVANDLLTRFLFLRGAQLTSRPSSAS